MLEGKNLLALIGGVLIILGCVLLPWVSFMGILKVYGYQSWQGLVCILAGAAAITFQFVKMPFGGIATLASCGIAFVLSLLTLVGGMSEGVMSAVGLGLYITIAGAAVAAFGGFQDFQKSRQA